MVKNLPAHSGDAGDAHAGDAGSIPESGSSPGGGHGNPLQYSCLENPMDRGAWGITVHRVAKSQTQLSMHTPTHTHTHTHMRTESWISHGGKREGLFIDCAGHINLPIVEIGDDPVGHTEEETKRGHTMCSNHVVNLQSVGPMHHEGDSRERGGSKGKPQIPGRDSESSPRRKPQSSWVFKPGEKGALGAETLHSGWVSCSGPALSPNLVQSPLR